MGGPTLPNCGEAKPPLIPPKRSAGRAPSFFGRSTDTRTSTDWHGRTRTWRLPESLPGAARSVQVRDRPWRSVRPCSLPAQHGLLEVLARAGVLADPGAEDGIGGGLAGERAL